MKRVQILDYTHCVFKLAASLNLSSVPVSNTIKRQKEGVTAPNAPRILLSKKGSSLVLIGNLHMACQKQSIRLLRNRLDIALSTL